MLAGDLGLPDVAEELQGAAVAPDADVVDVGGLDTPGRALQTAKLEHHAGDEAHGCPAPPLGWHSGRI